MRNKVLLCEATEASISDVYVASLAGLNMPTFYLPLPVVYATSASVLSTLPAPITRAANFLRIECVPSTVLTPSHIFFFTLTTIDEETETQKHSESCPESSG